MGEIAPLSHQHDTLPRHAMMSLLSMSLFLAHTNLVIRKPIDDKEMLLWRVPDNYRTFRSFWACKGKERKITHPY